MILYIIKWVFFDNLSLGEASAYEGGSPNQLTSAAPTNEINDRVDDQDQGQHQNEGV